LSGTGYYFWRNENLVGRIAGLATPSNRDPANTNIGPFRDQQFGFSVGGPFVQNKAFFFGNVDWGRKRTPTGYLGQRHVRAAMGHAGQRGAALDIARRRYDYDAGVLDEFGKPNDSNKLFVRTDLNLTARSNGSRSERTTSTPARASGSLDDQYLMPTNYYQFGDKTSPRSDSSIARSATPSTNSESRISEFATTAVMRPARSRFRWCRSISAMARTSASAARALRRRTS
jgi:hypothetical protein